ncbi:hypothetical protein SNOG_04378 [Parastagonospora nodorum SN15]|uniref:Uncharacterized protein n=1 Tax=Phaeosphaeria nodorum (strain SN15 / ATCC MYA-4574 / FGSC 10173) TaxID=321614 RepID=Q0UV36_PHANO|nr:hypothetical protein SNOG_04378 [Parastagonospora nodorum SN15]EAT88138.1 hypothetical protein SNOG_04378 [Parastagonospora nodorum SN15]
MARVAKMPLSKQHGSSNLRYARSVRSQGIAKKFSTKARKCGSCIPSLQAPSDIDLKPHVPLNLSNGALTQEHIYDLKSSGDMLLPYRKKMSLE